MLNLYYSAKFKKDYKRAVKRHADLSQLEYNKIAYTKHKAELDEKTITNGGWKCLHCGSLNASYVGTCRCGEEKPNPAVDKANDEKRSEIKDDLERLNMIKEYKSLLDSGVITQEEFDKKKAELMKL